MAKKTTTPEPTKPTPVTKATAKRVVSSGAKIFGAKVWDHGYTAIPNILVRSQAALGINTTQFNIIVQLLSYYINPDRPPFPSKEELAQRMGITTDTLRINIKKLEDRGLIRREQQLTSFGDWSSNTYHLDGLIAKLKRLQPKFDKEREERRALKSVVEAPKRTRTRTGVTNGTA